MGRTTRHWIIYLRILGFLIVAAIGCYVYFQLEAMYALAAFVLVLMLEIPIMVHVISDIRQLRTFSD
jgi:uncharacterized membrane protein